MSDEVLEQTRMTIGQHLEELRWRLLKAIGYISVALVVCLLVQQHLMEWATWPHRRVVNELQRQVRLADAPSGLRERIDEAKAKDAALDVRLSKLERRELKLREAVEPAGPRLDELVAAQEKLDERIDALEAALADLGDEPSAAQLAPITSEREAIQRARVELRDRYQKTALPYVDTLASVPDMRLMDIKYQGPFLSYLKLSFICALFLASPWVAREMWGFIAVGLYPHEKKHINLFAPLSLVCFMLGGVFGYMVLIPVGLYFLATYAPPEMMAGTFALSDYLSLFMTLTVVVGLVFELPLIMSFLTLIGAMNAERYRKYRRYWWFAAVVLGAMLTPPDPATQMLLAIPMCGLYELGIFISVFIRPTQREGEGEASDPPSIAPPGGDASSDDDSSATDTPEGDDDANEASDDDASDDEAGDDPECEADAEPEAAPEPTPDPASPASLIRPVEQPRVARGESPEPPPSEPEASPEPAPEPDVLEEANGPYEGEEQYEGEGDNDDPTLKYLYDDPADEEPPSEDAASEEPPSEDAASEPPSDAKADPEEPTGPFEGEEQYEGEGDNDDPTLKYLYDEPEPPDAPDAPDAPDTPSDPPPTEG